MSYVVLLVGIVIILMVGYDLVQTALRLGQRGGPLTLHLASRLWRLAVRFPRLLGLAGVLVLLSIVGVWVIFSWLGLVAGIRVVGDVGDRGGQQGSGGPGREDLLRRLHHLHPRQRRLRTNRRMAARDGSGQCNRLDDRDGFDHLSGPAVLCSRRETCACRKNLDPGPNDPSLAAAGDKLRAAVERLAGALEPWFVTDRPEPPAPPTRDILAVTGLRSRPPADFIARVQERNEVRRQLRWMVQDTGWSWPAASTTAT